VNVVGFSKAREGLDMIIDALTLVLCVVVLIITLTVMFKYDEDSQVLDEAETRQRLLHVVKNLRLSDMLALLNIPLGQYIQVVPVNEIKRHVSACRGCTELSTCDRCLKKGVPEKDMSFCPNNQSLLEHANKNKWSQSKNSCD
jgi:hypothetical protein